MTGSTSSRQFLLGGGFSSLAAIAFAKGLGFIESIVVARILGGNAFGLLALVLSITNVVVALSCLGIPSALTKFLSGEASTSRTAARTTLKAAVRLVAISTGVVSLGAAVVAIYLLGPYYRDPELITLLLVGILAAALTSPVVLFANALQGLKQVVRLNVLTIVAGAVGLPLAVLLSVVWSARGALIAFFVASGLPGALAIRAVYSAIHALPRDDVHGGMSVGGILNYGLPTVISGLIVLSTTYFLSSILAVGKGFADLGDFAVASSLAATISFIPAAVGVPLMPLLSSLSVTDPRKGKLVVPRVMRVISFLSVPAAVFLMSFSPEILALTYGPEFSGAAPLLSLLAAASLLAAVSGVIGSQIAGSGRMWMGLGVNTIWSGVVISSGLGLIPTYGAVGACLSILGGYLVLAVVLLVIGRRKLRLEFGGMGMPAIWSSLAVLAALSIASVPDGLRLAGGIAVTLATPLSVAFLLHADERTLIRDAIALVVPKRKVP